MYSVRNSTTLTDSVADKSPESNILVKLRRLKIEESLLSKNIHNNDDDFQDVNNNANCFSDLKSLQNELKHSFIDIRDLFEEVKANTCSQVNLKTLDINDVRKDVLNLEKKIHTLKSRLQSQCKSLKLEEEELTKQINEKSNKVEIYERKSKFQKKIFMDIVPSPVKNIITSPFKCPEVQQFQEFMINSKNRYGGWIPYSHNIFEKTWHKYFNTQVFIQNYEYQDVNVENSEFFQQFVTEVLQKIPGITLSEVLVHNKWYTKYVYLKERQQKALDKWKSNQKLKKLGQNMCKEDTNTEKSLRKEIKSIKLDSTLCTLVSDQFTEMGKHFGPHTLTSDLEDSCLGKAPKDTSNKINSEPKTGALHIKDKVNISYRLPLAYRNPTEQWNNRCHETKESNEIFNMDVESIIKRRIPDWRLALQTE